MKIFKNIKPEFTDQRGAILKIFNDDKTAFKSALLITSKAGAIRANHYHKKDSHYVYMLSGKMEYFEKPLEADDSQIKSVVLEAGDMIYTPPTAVHAMRILENTVWIVLAIESRHHKEYESDTTKIKLI